MIHANPHPKAGQVVKLRADAHVIGGQDYRIEDYWDRVAGKSWMVSNGNPACMKYAMRTGMSARSIPNDDEVLYGKIGGIGELIHISEISDDVEP